MRVNDSFDWKCAANYATSIWCHISRRSFMQTSFCRIVSTSIILKISCCNHSVALIFKVVVQLTFTQLNFSSLVQWWEECVEQAIPCPVRWHSVGLLALAQPRAEPRTMVAVGQHMVWGSFTGATSGSPFTQ